MTKVIGCGGRHFGVRWDEDALMFVLDPLARAFLRFELDTLHLVHSFTSVAHGRANGADMLIGLWAKDADLPVREYPADWKQHRRAAGPIRNLEMFNAEKPDLVVAFKGGNGTKNMIDIARRAGVEVITPGWEYMEKLIP